MRIATQAYATPKGDRSDCAVRALAVAAKMPYPKAHAHLSAHGRKPGRRTPNRVSHEAYKAAGLLVWMYHEVTSAAPTVAQFLKRHPTGRFVVRRRGHMFAIVNGVVHDWARGTGARSRVLSAWRVPA